MTDTLPAEIARQIGAAPPLPGEDEPEPQTPLGWALHWASLGLYVFPCEFFLGRPLIPKWYDHATTSDGAIVEWWSKWPAADVGAVPDRSGHFVLQTADQEGRISLYELEDQHGGSLNPAFETENRYGDLHLWFPGRALTSHHLLGRGLHVMGQGTFVFMPASYAPDYIFNKTTGR